MGKALRDRKKLILWCGVIAAIASSFFMTQHSTLIFSHNASLKIPSYGQTIDGNRTGLIAIMGDTQRTLMAEQFLLGREQNDEERKIIIQDIARFNPALLVHLGDMTCAGADASEWSYFDSLFESVRLAGIPVFPTLGNHDYYGGKKTSLHNLHTRFRQLSDQHFYSKRYRDLGLIWVESEESYLTQADLIRQQHWYEVTLREMEQDQNILGIVVFTHHPPFTNSKITGDEGNVQDLLLPPFFQSIKTLAFFSGHAHTYEHFLEKGKNFIVSGGGGGPRVQLREGHSQRHMDLFHGPSPRPFNYVLIDQMEDGVKIIVRGLEKGGANVHELDQFTISFNPKK